MHTPIADALASFIAEHIDSVYRLEILLHLLARPSSARTSEEVARELCLSPAAVASELGSLAERGLLARVVEGAGESFRYAPATAALDALVRALAAAYAERRTTVISAIYSRPNDKLRSFADAFKLRGDK